jgi:N-methylhydantoinase A
MRFTGQGYEVVAALPEGPYGADAHAVLREAFLAAYDTIFARRPPVHGVEVVNIRVSVSAAPPGRPLVTGSEAGRVERRERRLCLGREEATVPVIQRHGLGAGARLSGPALVEDGMSTLVLPSGAEAIMEAGGNLVVTLPEPATEHAR